MATKRLPEITIVRAYDVGDRDCGYRVLVDRLWPRGLTKRDLEIDEWAKDIAPSTELRKWFGHRPERWSEFKRRYKQELRVHSEAIDQLLKIASRRRMALIFGARDVEHSQAQVLKEFLQARRASHAKRARDSA